MRKLHMLRRVVMPLCKVPWAFIGFLMAALLAPSSAHAVCSDGSGSTIQVTLNPSPTRWITSGAAGTVFTGVLTLTASNCKPHGYLDGPTFQGIYFTGNFGTTAQSTNVTGLNVALASAISYSANNGCTYDAANSAAWSNANQTVVGIRWTQDSVCALTINFPIVFTKTAGTVSGTVNALNFLAAGTSWGQLSWSTSLDYGFANFSNYGLTAAIPVVATTCTLAASNVSVVLPTVSKGSLATAGSVAGITPFQLTLNGCNNIASGSYIATANWSFTEGPASNAINNSAASKANNVYVQILDSNRTAVTNGGTSVLATISAAGSYSTTYYAQYYSTGSATAGNVTGIAQLNITYN